MMAPLTRVQADFQEYLLRGATAIRDHVTGTERVPVETRLAIYGNAYRARLIEALQANFPVLHQLLGDGEFNTLGAAYVAAHDSPFFSIRYYGDRMAQFLASDPAYAAAPILAELADWEWSMTEVFDAADAPTLDRSAFAELPPPAWADLRFDFHPSLRRLTLSWNAPQLWKAVSAGEEHPKAGLSEAPEQWLLWRQDLHTFFKPLPAAHAATLDGARAGQSFGELCARLCEFVGEEQAPAQAASYLSEWVGSGLLVTLS